MACLTPGAVRDKQNGGTIPVPCGKCPACRLTRIRSWVFRLLQEEKIHSKALFVTLTYAPDYAPRSFNGLLTLQKVDFQRFMKRLRFNTGRKTIKYYAVGEYGSNTYRPHYHAIIFDAHEDEIEEAWSLGSVYFGQVSGDSIAYTAKYICKEGKIPMFETDDRVPEFSLMSKRLGASYLTPQIIEYHKNNVKYNLDGSLTDKGGYRLAMPRYYRNKIFTEAEKMIIGDALSVRYNKILEEAINSAGGSEEYFRSRYYKIRTMFEKNERKDNRNTI